MLQPRSIKRALTLWLGWGGGLILIAVAFMVNRLVQEAVQQRFDRSVLTRVESFATLTQINDGEIDLDFADEVMSEYEEPEGPGFFEIWLPGGFLLERSYSLAGHSLIDLINHPLPSPTFADVQLGPYRCRLVSAHFVPQDEDLDLDAEIHTRDTENALTVLVAFRRDDLDTDLARLRNIIFGSFLGLFVLLVLFSRFVVSRGLKPVKAIADRVGGLDANQLETPIMVDHVPDELSPIMTQLNGLLGRIDATIKRERRFTSDVAHELRTPIAELRSLTEVGLRFGDDHDYLKSVTADALDASIQLQRIVESLLRLTRADAGVERALIGAVRLAPLVARAVKLHASEARDRKVTWRTDLDMQDPVAADAEMIELVIANLVGNAFAYARPGSEVGIEVSRHELVARFAISNETNDLEQGDLESLFQRFWRKDTARGSSCHSGLGLALVESCCQLMNLQKGTRLDNSVFTVWIDFPRAEDAQPDG